MTEPSLRGRIHFRSPAPVRGRLAFAGDLLVATVGGLAGSDDDRAIGAFDPNTGESRWLARGVPALATATEDTIIGYARSGRVVALNLDGSERWQCQVPDDRPEARSDEALRPAPFVADAVVIDDGLVVAAGAEVVAASIKTGRTTARTTLSTSPRAVIARLGGVGDGLMIATLTERTDWDLGRARVEADLWRTLPSPESLRTAAGEAVGLDRRLGAIWRHPSPESDIVYGDRRPIRCSDAAILIGARAFGSGDSRYLSQFDDWILAFDIQTGTVRWLRDLPSRRGQFDAACIPQGIVCGESPSCYAVSDGSLRWQLSTDQVDRSVAPIAVDGRLVFGGHGVFLAADPDTGRAEPIAAFSRLASFGSITTTLIEHRRRIYLGVAEQGMPTELRCIEL